MKILIILPIVVITYLVVKRCFPKNKKINNELRNSQKFVVSEYLNRIEKESDDIREQPKEKYFITLWWGSDGLRLNEDGTTEWISKSRLPVKRDSKTGYTAIPHGDFEKILNSLECKMMPIPTYQNVVYSMQDCCTQSLANQYMNQYTNQKIQSTMSCINSMQSCAVRNSVVW